MYVLHNQMAEGCCLTSRPRAGIPATRPAQIMLKCAASVKDAALVNGAASVKDAASRCGQPLGPSHMSDGKHEGCAQGKKQALHGWCGLQAHFTTAARKPSLTLRHIQWRCGQFASSVGLLAPRRQTPTEKATDTGAGLTTAARSAPGRWPPPQSRCSWGCVGTAPACAGRRHSPEDERWVPFTISGLGLQPAGVLMPLQCSTA